MALVPYNTNILQALKWMQNNAPNIQALLQQKANWYSTFQTQFWEDFETNIFNLQTANNFGILIWCIILGVPSQLFGLDSNILGWAYGPNRQNYVYSGSPPAPPGENTVGGNFYGGGQTTVLNIQEARWALQLRYASLVSNGRIQFVNYMLNWIFNNGQPWDYAAGQYFYVADSTINSSDSSAPITIAPITNAFTIQYRIGPSMNFSAQFVELLNELQFGILPQFAGSSVSAVVET